MEQKRAAIYCRVSTHDQSCDRQERDLTEFAQRAGYQVVQIFKESVSGARDDRPVRKQVLKLAQARKIDLILVTELSRWGRSTLDLIGTLNDLHTRGVSLIAQTGMSFELGTPQGKLLLTVFAGLAEFERDLIRERINSGVAAAKARGQHCGRPVGTGKALKYEQKVLDMRAQGYSIRDTARHLKLSHTTVQKIINAARSNQV